MWTGRVVRKVIFLTLGTALFVVCLTLLYESMRSVVKVVAMGGASLLFLLSPRAARWSLWGPRTERPDDHLRPYTPPPPPTPAPPPTHAPPLTPDHAPYPHPRRRRRVPSPGRDVVELLATLADLRDRGMLDADESEQAKAAVLRARS